MGMKIKVIVNADDFGMSETVNEAIAEGFSNGIINSTSIMANMPAFDDAVGKLSCLEGIGLAVHLNIIEGKALTHCPSLCDNDGNFNLSFTQILRKSLSKDFLKEVENEFRMQIEKVLKYATPYNLDSHVHVHSIPPIFNIVCKLAKEYKIPFVRTQFENIYITPGHKENFTKKHFINFAKVFILNTFTLINKPRLKKYGLKTNDCVLGVGYTGMMNEQTIDFGLKSHEKKTCVIEIICHPDKDKNRMSNYTEYQAVLSRKLKNMIFYYKPTVYAKL